MRWQQLSSLGVVLLLLTIQASYTKTKKTTEYEGLNPFVPIPAAPVIRSPAKFVSDVADGGEYYGNF